MTWRNFYIRFITAVTMFGVAAHVYAMRSKAPAASAAVSDVAVQKIDISAISSASPELNAIKKAQREKLLLKQQLEAAKLRSELAKQSGVESENSHIYVISLSGIGAERQARILVPGVGEVSAKAGEKIPGGWRVESIDDFAVQARAPGGLRVVLPFYVQNNE
ncbi:hypothetical protein [Chromobacterium amazonense]|uniref:hypothetical protein n=1 Tax=Chromobacterium amazonense TaxID=1382803 RepID=UPI0011B25BF3|nr:hypothetical protein [Chromobacterium amazonense]